MKNITKSIIGLFAVFAFSCSPTDIQERPEVVTTDVPVLTAPQAGAIYELKQADAELQAERFTWSSANFGGAKVTYTVEIDTKANNFAGTTAFKNLGSVEAQNQLSVSEATMAEVALSLDATPYQPSEFVVRIKAVAGTNPAMLSNVIGIVINPYTNELPQLAVPGNHQGWKPPTAPRIASSAFGKTDYEGYVWLDGEHKFVAPDADGVYDWDKGPDYGDDGTFSGKLLEKEEKNITAVAGYYLIKADTALLTYKETLTNWGIVGDATPGGWDNSTNMTYNPTTKVWTITTNLTVGSMKFRANNSWDINYGDTGADGILEFDSPNNIAVATAGNYTITLDLSSPRAYKWSFVKN